VFYKLNVDAARPNEEGNWGLAAVIRDAEGIVVGARCWNTLILPIS